MFNVQIWIFRSRENLSRGRDFGRDSLGLRDGSEMVVSDACVKGKILSSFLCCLLCFCVFFFSIMHLIFLPLLKPFKILILHFFHTFQNFSLSGERKRHHHHHHHNKNNRNSSEFREQSGSRNRHNYWHHRMVITINLDE